jgi:uncharacterized protein (DUF1501 family)
MMNDWYSCDGTGNDRSAGKVAPRSSRRTFLQGTGITLGAALALWAGSSSALAQVAMNPKQPESDRDVLVTIFLRGAADGLSMVVPYGDDDYYRARPTLGLAAPNKGGGGTRKLDDFFGLHPALAPLFPYYENGALAAVHAVGSGDQTRSHFEAMATMERGFYVDAGREPSGWVARYLNAAPPANNPASPLRAIAFGNVMPDQLRGATEATVLDSLASFRLETPRPELADLLKSQYQTGGDAVTLAGREILSVLDTLKRVNPADYKPENGATYPDSGLGNGLRQTAFLLKAGVGLEAACLDKGGWDTHVGQGGATGILALLLEDLAKSLAAFAQDLGPKGLERVTVVVMTEFGRRVKENSGLGTDHGRAGTLLALGGHINGGKVYGKWPGLKPENLEEGLDLKVTTDYREILAEIITQRLGGAAHIPAVFPGMPSRFLGLARG